MNRSTAGIAERYGTTAGMAVKRGSAGRLAAFIGSTPNIGTTVLSYAAALLLSTRTSSNVGYVCLQLKSSKLHRYLGRDEAAPGLDRIRADLKARSLTPGRLLPHCERVKESSLHLLFGSMQREQAEFYQPGDIDHLLEAARGAFDLTIVEVGAYWDNAATVSAMLGADERIAVTTPDLGHFQEDMNRGLKLMAPLYGINLRSLSLAINKMLPSRWTGGITTSDIRRETALPVIAEVGTHPELLDAVNQGRLTEFVLGHAGFRKELEPLVDKLMASCELPLRPMPSPGVRRWRWIPRYSGS